MRIKNKFNLFKSKYIDIDLENLPEEKFNEIKIGVYLSIFIRTSGGIILIILCVIALILGGKYAW